MTISTLIDTNAIAFSYIRFSRKMQKLGRSEDRQMESCVRWCEKHKITLSDDTFLDDGRSGYTGDHVGPRGQLRRFLDLVEAGKIARGSYLVVESLDRLGRDSVNEALGRFINLLNAGIKIVTLMDGERVYGTPFTLADVLTSVVVMERANDESKTKANRSRDNWQTAFERARVEKKPVGKQVAMWLELAEEDGKKVYREREDRVAIVKRIFRDCVAGHGFVAIAKRLNADEEPAFRGGTWCSSSVKEILDNRCVLGEWEPKDGKGVIEGYFPQVIKPAEWEATQLAMKERRGRVVTKQTFNFQFWQQIGRCGVCFSNMNLVAKGVHKYLACSNKRKGLCKASLNVRADIAEEVFRNILVKVGALGLIQTDAEALTDRITALDASIHAQQVILQRHMAAAATFTESTAIYGLIAQTETEIRKLKEQRQTVEAEHATQAAAQTDKAWLMANLPLIDRDDRQRANALLRRLGVTVRITGGQMPVYVCEQRGKDFLQLMTKGKDVIVVPISQEQRTRFKEQDADGTDLAKVDEWLASVGMYSSATPTQN